VSAAAAVLALVVLVTLAWRPLAAWSSDDAGNRELLRGHDARALQWFDAGLRYEPSWALLHEDRGRALLASDPAAALAEFERAACGAPCTAEEGDALVRLGRPEAAVERFVNAKAVGRVSDIALSLSARGRYDEAMALEHELIRRLGDGFVDRADVASSYWTLGKIQASAAEAMPPRARSYRVGAIAAYGAATRLAPYNEGYLLSYGFAQAQWGDADAARSAFERMLAIHPHQSDAEAALARLGKGEPNAGAP
jgi:tetratricopeptide (TPR) repeat protein